MVSIDVKFKVNCETKLGESIFLIGNVKELHSWNLSNPIMLHAENYNERNPVWETNDILLPVNVDIYYKFIKKTTDGKFIWEWESNSENRKLKLVEGKHITVVSSFGKYQNEIDIEGKKGSEAKKDWINISEAQIVEFCN